MILLSIYHADNDRDCWPSLLTARLKFVARTTGNFGPWRRVSGGTTCKQQTIGVCRGMHIYICCFSNASDSSVVYSQLNLHLLNFIYFYNHRHSNTMAICKGVYRISRWPGTQEIPDILSITDEGDVTIAPPNVQPSKNQEVTRCFQTSLYILFLTKFSVVRRDPRERQRRNPAPP